jgi:hypothetical protein
MLWLRFRGWFQCRLATDPDPYDEPRGVGGYVRALPGEPDLDRIIRLQPEGAVIRSHCPQLGVTVDCVFMDGQPVEHPLLGASVRLLDDPKFEGRNWIIAQDGFEPIVPFHLAIASPRVSLDRSHADKVVPPFAPELRAQGLVFAPGEIREASGIWDLAAVWRTRSSRLESEIPTLDGAERVCAEIRLREMRAQLAGQPSKSTLRYFPAKMPYFVRLAGPANIADPDGIIADVDRQTPWSVDLWCGAWDPDALSGFMLGYLGLPLKATANIEPAETSLAPVPPQERRQ